MNILNSEKFSLYIAIFLPIFAIILTVIILIPKTSGTSSVYDFVYISDTYNVGYFIELQNGHIVKQPLLDQNNRPIPINGKATAKPDIYHHDVVKNESRKLTFEEATKLTLTEGYISPGGYEVICGGNSNRGMDLFEGLFFGGGDCSRRFLVNREKRASTPVKLTLKDQWDFRLLGWIKR